MRLGLGVLGLAHACAAAGRGFVVQLATNSSMAAVVEEYELDMRSGDVELVVVGDAFRAVMGEFPLETLGKMHADSRVAAIAVDRDMELQGLIVQGQSPRHLSRLASTSTAVTRPFTFDAVSGHGVEVYLFDTGIDEKQPGLTGVQVGRLTDVTESAVPRGCDPHGHGTAMAGLISSETFGVLKRAALVDVRVADDSGKMKMSQLLRGLGAAAERVRGSSAAAVFVVPIIAESKNWVLASALAAIPEEVALVLPAGNRDADACDCVLLDSRRSARVLVVGAVDERNRVARFSGHGDCVDVYTSGIDVTTLQSTDVESDSLVVSVNGTSASCAIGAGVVGYYMSLGLTAQEAVSRVSQTAEDVATYPHHCKLLQLEL